MKKLALIPHAALLAFGLSTQANAAFLNGSISFSGGLDATTLADIVAPLTTFTPSVLALASGSTGDLSGSDGLAGVNPFSFGDSNIITYTAGAFTFELLQTTNLTSSAISCDALGLCTDSLAFDMVGAITGGGFDPTAYAGTWTANGSCQGAANGSSCTSDRAASWSSSVTALGVDPETLQPPPNPSIFIDPNTQIPTQLLSFGPNGINADIYLPLTSGATTSSADGINSPLATLDNYGWVKSNVAITLSTATPSTGYATLGKRFGNCGSGLAGAVGQGYDVCVDSLFDVFFDVTITDIDPTTNFFDSPTLVTLPVLSDGPIPMEFHGICSADLSQANLGCLPPSGFPYVGHFKIDTPLGLDINGNNLNDFLHFTFGAHNVGGVTDTFINDNSVNDTFNSTIVGTGAVDDAATDPEFSFTLSGPVTASQEIVYAAQNVPEPSYLLLFSAGFSLMGLLRRNHRKT
ncbi:MAG: hypothetical protein methR_P2302 [Methyloprofundus sp.]|nr:MAG: hypothetical protein methR_P2302 [Methyloprofundus sp.]